MSQTILLLVTILLLPTLAQAQVYKCRSVSGQIVIADQPCQDGSRTEAVVQPEPVTEAQRLQAQEVQAQRLKALEGLSTKRQVEETQRAERQAQAAKVKQSSDAVRECVRDVERSNAPDSTQLDLIAACQSAGRNQQLRQTAPGSVSACVRDVERLNGSNHQKARAIASCHGAEVQAESAAPVFIGPVPRHRLPLSECPEGRCGGGVVPKPKMVPENSSVSGKVQPCKPHGNSLSCK